MSFTRVFQQLEFGAFLEKTGCSAKIQSSMEPSHVRSGGYKQHGDLGGGCEVHKRLNVGPRRVTKYAVTVPGDGVFDCGRQGQQAIPGFARPIQCKSKFSV